MKLNLGCGSNKMDDYVNVDVSAKVNPDVVHNLENFPWPFEDDSINEILMIHSLEHMGETKNVFLKIIQELYRICKNQSIIHIIVPNPFSINYLKDPTHVRKIIPEMFELFDLDLNNFYKSRNKSHSTLAIDYQVDFQLLRVEPKHYMQEIDADIRFAVLVKKHNVNY